MFNSLGVGFAFGNQLGEFEAFVGGQGNFINLLHGDILVWEGQFTKGRIQISQSPDKRKIHNFRLEEVVVPPLMQLPVMEYRLL